MNQADDIRTAIDRICDRLKRRPHVLIVEDEEGARDLFAAWFKSIRYAVSKAGSTQEAIAFLKSNPCIDVVWLDLKMPEESGIGVLQFAKDTGLNVPIIVVTGHTDEGVHAECMELGAIGVVRKPNNLEEIKEIVQRFDIK